MEHKTRTKALSWLLTLAMVLSLLPGMSLSALATSRPIESDPTMFMGTAFNKSFTMRFSNYGSYNGYHLDDIENLVDWYVIDFQPGTNGDKGTVTLLAERPLELVPYDKNTSPDYVDTSIKSYLDGFTAAEPMNPESINFLLQFADAIIDTDTNGDNAADSKLYILSNTDIYNMGYPNIYEFYEFLKFDKAEYSIRDYALTRGFVDYYEYVWWLRDSNTGGFTYFDSQQGGFASSMHNFPVRDKNGKTIFENREITAGDYLGLRPAMKLDLNKVSYRPDGSGSGIFYIVPVTAARLDKTDEQTVTVGDKVTFNAYLAGCNVGNEGYGMEAPSDKSVTWSVVDTNSGSVTLYYDENCTKPVGTESVPYNVPVYAKGVAVGDAKVRVTSSADSTKYAECPVKVTRSVTLTGGANATPDPAAGISQTELTGAMETVTFTAEKGYHFEDFSEITANGVKATRTSDTVVTVSGTPTDNAAITIPDAVAISPYSPYLMNSPKAVKFCGKDWYVIKDESTSANKGTITLLAKDALGSSPFNPRGGNNVYKGSAIQKYLDDMLETGDLWEICDAVVSTDLTDVGVTGARLFLLSAEEANALDSSLRFCAWGTGGWSNIWFTRSPGTTGNGAAMCVSASQKASNTDVGNVCGVRPAFQLDLTMVNFNSETREFTFKPNDSGRYVMILGGDFATASPSNGASQTSLTGAMTTVTYTANQNYTFEPFDDIVKNGITVKRISDTQITVSGTPTSNVRIKIPEPVTAFSTYVNDDTKTVMFNGLEWYVIADNSKAQGDGTVTLLAKYPITTAKFHQNDSHNRYRDSSIKKYLDSLTFAIEAPTLKTYGQTGDGISAEVTVANGSFTGVADAIAYTDLEDVGVTGARIYLLSVSEAMALKENIRKCTKANGSASTFWFLRTPNPLQGQMAKVVVSGTGNEFVQYVNSTNEIRPALRLDISKIRFNSETNTFEPSGVTANISKAVNLKPVLSETKIVTTRDSIQINGFYNASPLTEAKYQYSLDGGKTWQPKDGTKNTIYRFDKDSDNDNLTAGTTYQLRVRTVETEHTEGVETSDILSVTTPIETIALTGVSINGTAQVGSTLTTSVTGKDGVPTGVTYQWYRGEVSDENKISGATGAAYTLTGADYGERIKVTATGVNSDGDPISKNATTTNTVTAVPAADLTGRAIRTTATQTTITVLGFGNTSTRHYEYACVAGNVTETPATGWQSGNEFTGLTANTDYTVFVRTGGEKWQTNGTAISANVKTLDKPLPYTGVTPTVTMDGYTYGETASAPTVSDAVGGATATYKYRQLGAKNWMPYAPENTLDVGTYEIHAKITASDCSNYTTAATNFVVSPAKLTAPTIAADGVTVTISGSVPESKKVQYVVVNQNATAPAADSTAWKSATLDGENKFTLTGLKESHNYKVYVRSVPAATETNYTVSAWSAEATGTTPTTKTVVYDLNGGKVKSGKTFALTATFTETPYTLASGENIERPGYTFNGWKLNNDGSALTTVTSGGTYVAQWMPKSYSVTFDPNNGTDTTATQDGFTYGVGKKLDNNFNYSGHVFAGWATTANGAVRYGDGQTVTSLTTGDSVTLYAVWGDATTNVTGTITSAEGGVTEVTLKRGDIQIGETQIAALAYSDNQKYSGSYTFKSVPDGIYNIVAVQYVERLNQDGNTFTETLTVTRAINIVNGKVATGAADFTMPECDYSSVVSVSGTDTPPVVVGGLDAEAEKSALDDRSVTVTMTVEKKEETTADVETKEAIEAIASTANAPTEERDYLNIDVKKEITKNGQSESEEAVTETAQLIDISIPYDLSGKSNAQISLYRFHDGKATKLGTSSNDTSYYTLDRTNNLIVLHTKLFSTYAIGYNPDVTDPGSGNNGNNGGSGAAGGGTTYAPTISNPSNGTVSIHPTSPKAGDKVTITAKPNEGYEIDTVTATDANGKTVAVTKNADGTYAFTQPVGKVKIDVTFKAASTTDALVKFNDVNTSDWYADAVHWALNNGVMNGVSPKYFNPNGDTTRAMVATMLWRLEGSPVVSGEMKFVDVADGTWYAEAVRWASDAGIITGSKIPAKTTPWPMGFRPDDAVTREQLAAMLYRYAQYKKADVSASASLSGYGDASGVSVWATDAMQWAVGSGIINGMDGNLAPVNHATRAQVATMLMRYSTAK